LGIAVLVSAVVLLVRVPFSLEPPGRDQSLFLAQSQALLDGASLYTEIWEHKPPGVLVAYAAAQLLAGREYFAIHLLNGLAGWLAALGLTLLLLRGTGSSVGAVAGALLYLAFFSGIAFGGFWGIAQAEVLMDPFLVLALLLLTARSHSVTYAGWRGVGAGLCIAIVVGLKYSALPLVALVLPILLNRDTGPRIRRVTLLAFAGGLAAPLLLGLTYLAATERFEAFWTAAVQFNAAHGSVARLSRTDHLVAKVLYLPRLLLPVYLFGVAGVLAKLLRPGKGDERAAAPIGLETWAILLWLLCLAQVFWQGKFWVYHFHVVLLPLCILAGVGIADVATWLALKRVRPSVGAFVVLVLLSVTLVPYGRRLGAYLHTHHLLDAWRGRIERQVFLSTYRWGGLDFDAWDTLVAAERLKADTRPDERVFVWGFEPGIYVHSGRKPASRFFYDYPLMPRFTTVHERLLEELIEDLETHRPARIILVRRDANDIEPTESLAQLLALPRLRAHVETNYDPVWTSGDFLALRRRTTP
jgi:hypothetical protein